jgi:hypothetical protein
MEVGILFIFLLLGAKWFFASAAAKSETPMADRGA